MPRLLKVSAGALNVRVHPHSPETYRDFLQALYRLRQPVKMPGGRMGMITLMDISDLSGGQISGQITTFVKIDTDGKWFDEEALDDASPETVRQVKLLPKVHPNSAIFRFSFDVNRHLFVFESYSRGQRLSPKAALRLLTTLANEASITREFNEPAISIVQDEGSVDRIFSLDKLTSITFHILRPNPDIWDDGLEAQLDNHFAATGAQSMTVNYRAAPGASLQDTPALRRISEATIRNGQIDASGRDAGGHQSISTENFPLITQTTFEQDGEGEAGAFTRLTQMMRRRVQ